ncbi:FecR family protein [Methylogaea oryzae]|uniref:FecR protein domain-containing protein n=2 Tax=Methylogaea oryzae TaxID=1295382 RepID=A0A8D5AGS3_9GAMM|nr:FecR family protein [Methylogaea oryzae]BBL69506.1 hypothetical protein MoryE10_01120 [Methylogaea oryzae]
MTDEAFEARRRALLRWLGAGFFMLGARPAAHAGALGDAPGPLPPGRSIYRIDGDVLVNGQTADEQTRIGAGDRIQTGPGSQVVFAVGQDAFILRERSELRLSGGGGLIVHGLRVVTGALLSVFGKREHEVQTQFATIGIRGTGVYVEAEAERSYVCTCYGRTQITAEGAPEQTESIVSVHHDAPRYISGEGERRIQPAPVKNHTDEELALIEALTGRTAPFSFTMPGRGSGGENY